ncbi:MAG: DUF5011 domain-containing protein, partial [Gammaproteobacteria bacterium]|nr:DUF5011 domain-containing protein [Gammaproteobacteria bacterium]
MDRNSVTDIAERQLLKKGRFKKAWRSVAGFSAALLLCTTSFTAQADKVYVGAQAEVVPDCSVRIYKHAIGYTDTWSDAATYTFGGPLTGERKVGYDASTNTTYYERVLIYRVYEIPNLSTIEAGGKFSGDPTDSDTTVTMFEQVSAIEMNCPGYQLTLYDQPNFRGNRYSTVDTIDNLETVQWNDRAQSARLEVSKYNRQPCRSCIFEHSNNDGEGHCVDSHIYQTPLVNMELGGTTLANDITSVSFTGYCAGAQVRIFEAPGLGGANYTVYGNQSGGGISNLKDGGFNDRSMSIAFVFNQPPVMILNGDAVVTISAGEIYSEQSAIATDHEDGSLEVTYDPASDHAFDTSIAGAHKVIYKATDSQGLSATASRTVIVQPRPPLPNWKEQYNMLASDIGVGADGTVKVVDPVGHIHTWTSSGWAENYNMGSGSRIAVHPDGNAWVVQEGGTIFRSDTSGWHEVYNVLAKDISVGADGMVRIVDPVGHIFTQTASGWQENYNLGTASRIAVDPDGNAWVVLESGAIFRQTGTSEWQEVYNILARDIAVGPTGQVWIISKDGKVFVKNAEWNIVDIGSRTAKSISLDQNS